VLGVYKVCSIDLQKAQPFVHMCRTCAACFACNSTSSPTPTMQVRNKCRSNAGCSLNKAVQLNWRPYQSWDKESECACTPAVRGGSTWEHQICAHVSAWPARRCSAQIWAKTLQTTFRFHERMRPLRLHPRPECCITTNRSFPSRQPKNPQWNFLGLHTAALNK